MPVTLAGRPPTAEDCRDVIVGGCPQASDAAAAANSNIRFADTPRIRRSSELPYYGVKLWRNKQLWALNVRSIADLSAESDDGGAPAAGFRRCVTKLHHKGCPRKHGADHFALRSDAAPVDDAQGAIAHPVSFDEVFFYNGAHIPGWDGVQVEHIGDGDADGFVVLCLHRA